MANILIVSANLRDWTKDSGGKERTATLAEALPEHKITFLSFSWSGEVFEKYISKNIHQIQLPTPATAIRKYRELIKDVAKVNYDLAFEMLKDELNFFTQKIVELSESSDLVIVDHASISPLVPRLDVPIVFNSHNCELTMAKQLYPEQKSLIGIVEKIEKEIIAKSSAVTYCSKQDIKEIQDTYGKINKSIYIPNGAIKQPVVDYKLRMQSKNIMFVGSGHPPNVAAAKKMIPLAKLMPDYNFLIVGSAGVNLSFDSYPKNVKILGHVNDKELDKYFKTSLAFINPMDAGSGTHLKMMKALSYGIPIITSKVGARGFSSTEIEESMLIAESLQDMQKAILKLSNEKTVERLVQGSQEVFKEYDWDTIKQTYSEFIDSMLSSSKKVKKKKDAEDKPKQKQKVLVYSIIRNREANMKRFYDQLKKLVIASPEYEFYLSIYENDSVDQTKQELFSKDWSFFKGVSIISENIDTEYFESVKDAQRVENLAKARNRAIEAGGFLENMDYVLMVEGDVVYSTDHARQLLTFKDKEPEFDVVSTISLRKNGRHYDWWATRTSAVYNPNKSEIEPDYETKKYGKYYSTSNGLCLYKAKMFKDGARHGWINKVTKEFDCEMVVVCQEFHKLGYNNIYILYTAEAHHMG
jgi:glycosyltransferase involved in cell wall biosynthesis